MGKGVSVKGEAIRKFADDLVALADSKLPSIENEIKAIDVGFPSFGVIGIPLLAGHVTIRNEASSNVGDAKTVISKWREGLNETAQTWDKAEEESTANN
ncbi:MAG TPA: hypothetical protein VKY91_09120 [Vulgatibacteraceae bacterium]|nr:hypothetical protein [Vulgatibacteraceae bacterium]